jgi:HK97 family phage major capsid protein
MPYNSLIDRSDAGGLIPTEYSNEIVTATVQESAALRLCRRVAMATGQQRVPVLSTLPQSFWVQGDTGLKQTTEAAWSGVFLNAEEIATIVPVPEAVIADASFDIWTELKIPIAQSIAVLIDAAVFSGTNAPATWPQAIVPAATAAGNTVDAVSTAAEGGVVNDLANLLGIVEADGYEAGAFAASRSLRPLLRSARSSTGELLSAQGDNFTLDRIWGVDIAYAVATSMGSTLAIAGEWSDAIIGVRQDLTYKLLDQAVFQDGTGAITLNLAQQDALGLRVTMRLALAIAVPAALSEGGGATPYPFAVLNPAGTPLATGHSSRSAKK